MILLATLFSLFLAVLKASSLGKTNALLLDRVTSSPAFITQDQWYLAYNASLPYLATPLTNITDHFTYLKNYTYPDFMNYAVTIGNISSIDELAQYYAQMLYQSNGFMLSMDPACYNATSANCQALGLNTTVFGVDVNYYGRGYLWIQGQSAYSSLCRDMFGSDSTLLLYPDALSTHKAVNFATSAWYWRTFVAPGRTNYGSTTAILRPTTCNGSVTNPTAASVAAWNVYVAVLKILSPSATPSSGFC